MAAGDVNADGATGVGESTTGARTTRTDPMIAGAGAVAADDVDFLSAVHGGAPPFSSHTLSPVSPSVAIRDCHGYIPEEYIHALYPYPLRIRAEDAYPKCILRKKGEVISILSDKNCEIISHPYPRYESQDTGIYKIMKLLAPAEF